MRRLATILRHRLPLDLGTGTTVIPVQIVGSLLLQYGDTSTTTDLKPTLKAELTITEGKHLSIQLHAGARGEPLAHVTIYAQKEPKMFPIDDQIVALHSQPMTDRIAAANPRAHALLGHSRAAAAFFYRLEIGARGRQIMRTAVLARFPLPARKDAKQTKILAAFPKALTCL